MEFNKERRSYSVSKKLFIIAFLILLFLIPSGLIITLIHDRSNYRTEALEDISSKWGKTQKIGNLMLYIPYTSDKKTNYIKVLPENLLIDANVTPEVRYRGIFKFIMYNGSFNIKGNFKHPDIKQFSINEDNILWDKAFVQYEITDLIGLKDVISFKWNNEAYTFQSGLKESGNILRGVYCDIPYNDSQTQSFELNISLRGCEELFFYPNGRMTQIKLNTKWENPSFIGAFLPEKKSSVNGNLVAEWKVLDLNRDYPQVFLHNYDQESFSKALFGMKFLLPTDLYKQTNRAIKYEILFVALTFMMIFMLEFMYSRRIHPLQYILIGFALVIFYLLLLSLAEQIGFALAYLISSVMIILMISLYSLKILASKKFAFITGFVLTLLYTFLYILLINQDYSLILGSFGLLFILAVIMFVTRNVNWYKADE